MKNITVQLSWTIKPSDGLDNYEMDASVFMLGSNGKIPEEGYFVFYNNVASPDSAVIHSGEIVSQARYGGHETITVDLVQMDPFIQELVFVVTLYDAQTRQQNFGQASEADIRIYDQDTGQELSRYNLSQHFAHDTAVESVRLYKRAGEWKIQAVGQGYRTDLQSFVDRFYLPA